VGVGLIKRHIKAHHHFIPRQIKDGAVRFVHDVGHTGEEFIEEGNGLVGLDADDHAREIAQIGEEDNGLAAFPPRQQARLVGKHVLHQARPHIARKSLFDDFPLPPFLLQAQFFDPF
jgi:hypothetical protein